MAIVAVGCNDVSFDPWAKPDCDAFPDYEGTKEPLESFECYTELEESGWQAPDWGSNVDITLSLVDENATNGRKSLRVDYANPNASSWAPIVRMTWGGAPVGDFSAVRRVIVDVTSDQPISLMSGVAGNISSAVQEPNDANTASAHASEGASTLVFEFDGPAGVGVAYQFLLQLNSPPESGTLFIDNVRLDTSESYVP